MTLHDAVSGLLAGDFTRLSPLFESAQASQIVRWHTEGLFTTEPAALAEAVTCAAFNGEVDVLEYLLAHGSDPSGGIGTGMNACHWAANRGQLAAAECLVRHDAPLEALNGYGGTVLGAAVWSAIHEPKPDHLRIIEVLLEAGARVEAAGYPTGNTQIDELVRQHGAAS